MKKIFSRILAVVLLSAGIIGVSSCDYLDQKPENLKTTDMIWNTYGKCHTDDRKNQKQNS